MVMVSFLLCCRVAKVRIMKLKRNTCQQHYESRHEKTDLLDFRPGPTHTDVRPQKRLEISELGSRGIVLSM